jgi:UDP-glucuronate decarboxylase
MDYRREHNLDVKIIRIFNTYGPRMALDDGRVVSNFLSQARPWSAALIAPRASPGC